MTLLRLSRYATRLASSRATIDPRTYYTKATTAHLSTARTQLQHSPRQCVARHYSAQLSHGDRSTIFALSTAPGRAAIAVIRISGQACLHIYKALCPGKAFPEPRVATIRKLYNPVLPQGKAAVLDPNALVLYFPQPNTVTGEDVLELHVHGGLAIVQSVLQAIPRCQLPSSFGPIRFADPGEFTRRAFLNDKLDLTQVEALGDILSATTEQQRRLSIRGSSNVLSQQYNAWRKQLLYARGELEALIDFSEDQHFDESPADLLTSVASQVSSLIVHLQAHSQNAVRGELLRNGISLSLLGAPNVGKSSLLNRIVGREAAIVSQEAGTTRDVVEIGVDLGGYLCRLSDTAGLRPKQTDVDTQNPVGLVEEEGIRRAKLRAAESDVVIAMFDFHKTPRGLEVQLDHQVVETARLLQQDDKLLIVLNKLDLAADHVDLRKAVHAVQQVIPSIQSDRIFAISCKEGQHSGSIQQLLQGLIAHFDKLTAAFSPTTDGLDTSIWHESLGATERHRVLLDKCTAHLADFVEVANAQCPEDVDIVVAAEHLRAAAECLAKITGRGEAGDVEEVLGVVFEKFCVGK